MLCEQIIWELNRAKTGTFRSEVTNPRAEQTLRAKDMRLGKEQNIQGNKGNAGGVGVEHRKEERDKVGSDRWAGTSQCSPRSWRHTFPGYQ